MFLSILIRLFSSFILFVLLARAWGVETFGAFMFPFVISSLAVIFVDYGFGIQLVRDIGRTPDRIGYLVARALAAKLILTAILLVIAAAFAAFWPAPPGFIPLFRTLLAAAILNSFGIFFSLPLRTLNRFQDETRTTLLGNLSLMLAVGALAFSGYGPVPIALGFLAARCVYLVVAWQTYRRTVGTLPWHLIQRKDVTSVLRSGLPFGIHIALGTLYFQVDTLIIQHLLGQYDLGIYQAGMRLLIGGLILSEVLTNIYLPLMARATEEIDRLIAISQTLLRHLLVAGVLGFILLMAGSTLIVHVLYGPEFSPLAHILPYFAIILLIRYAGTCWGLLLTVSEKQIVRVLGVSIAFAFNILMNFVLIPKFGIMGSIQASILTHLLLNGVYIGFVLQQINNTGMTWRSWSLLAIAFYHGVLTLYLQDETFGLFYIISSMLSVLLVVIVGMTKSELAGFYQRISPAFKARI